MVIHGVIIGKRKRKHKRKRKRKHHILQCCNVGMLE